MDKDLFVVPRLGFSLQKPSGWTFTPGQWSPGEQLDPQVDHLDQWSPYAALPFCGAVKPHVSRSHVFAMLQVSARPMSPPSAVEAAALLEGIQGVLRNQNPQAEILEAASCLTIAGCPANVLRCRLNLSVEVEEAQVPTRVISRSYMIFGPRYAFTLGLSSSADPAFYLESDFVDILASLRIV